MSPNLAGTIQDIERLEDPRDKAKVFYRIKFSSKPSRDFIEDIYDCWNDPTINQSSNQSELLMDYQGNLLIHAATRENSEDLIRLLHQAILSINQR